MYNRTKKSILINKACRSPKHRHNNTCISHKIAQNLKGGSHPQTLIFRQNILRVLVLGEVAHIHALGAKV